MTFPNDPQFHINLEQQRKRAKDLRKAYREGNIEAAIRIARASPRARNLSPKEVLASTFTLSDAQLVVAREAGFSSWPGMKHHVEEALSKADIGESIIDAAFAGNDNEVRALVARDPGAARRSIDVAAVVADDEAASAMLEADPSLAGRSGGKRHWTPLLYLCSSRYRRTDPEAAAARLRIVRLLLGLGADVNAPGREVGFPSNNATLFDQEEWRPIDAAAVHVASPELVRLLLDRGAALDKTVAVLSQAVRGGSIEVLRLFLERLPESIWWQVGWAAKACVQLDRADMARLLAAHNAPRILEQALLEAISLERDAALIEILLGTDTSHPPTLSVWQNAYRVALRHGHQAAANVIRRRGVDAAAVTAVDRTIAACVNGDRDELRRLLQLSPNLSSEFREDDHRMLPWAVRTRRYLSVPLLLEARLDPNVPGKDGETPLHLAVRGNSLETIEVLLDAGAAVDARNFDSETPLDLALAHNDGKARERLAQRLLDAGARPAQESSKLEREEMNLLFERAVEAAVFGDLAALRDMLDEEPALVHARSPRPHRATLLNYCGANGVEEARQRTPENAPAIMQLLLDRGSDVNATCNLYGGGATTLGLLLTSIHPVRAGLRTRLMEILVNAGATFDGASGVNGIMGAAALGRLDLVRNSFNRDGSLKTNTTKSQMQSAFLWASEYGRTSVVEFLLDHGADADVTGGNNMTALHLAALGGHLDTVKLLLKRKPPLEATNAWGGTVLGCTLWGAVNWDPTVNYVPVIEALIDAGAIVKPEFVTWWAEEDAAPPIKARVEQLLRRDHLPID